MVRREKQRIGASVVKDVGKEKGNDNRSPFVDKTAPRSSKGATTSYSRGRVEERSERISSSSRRSEIARSQWQGRLGREQPPMASTKAAITPSQVESRTRSARSPPAVIYSYQSSRARSESGPVFRTMSNRDRQTFLGPIEFPLEHSLTLTEASASDITEDKASQEREAILGPIEFLSPTLDSTSSDSDWVGRISSILNPSNKPGTIDKNRNPMLLTRNVPLSDNADWSDARAVTPVNIRVGDADDKNSNPAGSTSSNINFPMDMFNNIFSCNPVNHEPKESTAKFSPGDIKPTWKYEHFLAAPGHKREHTCADPLDFGFLYLQESTGTDLSYNITDLDLDLDESTMVTREALTFQPTLQSTFTGTNLSETIVDDVSVPQAMDSLQLKIERLGESVRQGLDNLAARTIPISSPQNKTSAKPNQDWSNRKGDNLADEPMPKSSPPLFTITSVSALTPDWSSRLDNVADLIMPVSAAPPIIAPTTTTTRDWASRNESLAAKTIIPVSSPPITSSVTPTTAYGSSPLATNSRVHFASSVGNAIRRRDMDASRLQREIDRLRAKVTSAKMMELQGGLCNTRKGKNRIRSAPVSGAAKDATKTSYNPSALVVEEKSRSQSNMIRVHCGWLDE
jgi:hypothetical protein